MKLHRLINQVEWPDVQEAILKHYPDQAKQLEGYRVVFDKMLITEPIDQPGYLVITPYPFDDDEDKPDGADAPGDVVYFDDSSPSRQSVEFSPRAELLGMDIQDQTLYSGPELVAHVLWETTWYGFDEQQVQDKLESIMSTVDKIKNYTEEEREANLIPWDQAVRELELDDED